MQKKMFLWILICFNGCEWNVNPLNSTHVIYQTYMCNTNFNIL